MVADIEQLKFAVNYTFKNRALMREAVTHRSYAAEAQLKYDNQRLEFLGDAVLEIILTEYIFHKYPTSTEGVMTKMRSALAQQETLAGFARCLNLGSFLLMGHGERLAGGDDRDSTLCDLFESILGGIYLDGGLDEARKFVLFSVEHSCPEPHLVLVKLNPKGTLQEYAQHKWGAPPVYKLVESFGPDHARTFICEVSAQNFTAQGQGGSRRLAESDAAKNLIEIIADTDESVNNFF